MSKDKDTEISTVKDLLSKVKGVNDVDITDILGIVPTTDEEEMEGHIPVHQLTEIKSKLGEKKEVIKDDGSKFLEPLYTEEEKVKVIFGLLSERGINLLDYLERVLAENGFNTSLVMSINETMGKTTEVLRDIAEMQYRKAKLENERTHLEIQKYKADLKKREIEIKEREVDAGPGNTNIIAVGSTAELLEVMSGKNHDKIKEVDIEEQKDEQGEE